MVPMYGPTVFGELRVVGEGPHKGASWEWQFYLNSPMFPVLAEHTIYWNWLKITLEARYLKAVILDWSSEKKIVSRPFALSICDHYTWGVTQLRYIYRLIVLDILPQNSYFEVGENPQLCQKVQYLRLPQPCAKAYLKTQILNVCGEGGGRSYRTPFIKPSTTDWLSLTHSLRFLQNQ